MTLHLLALPHTIVKKGYSVCAYTQKVVNFALMMSRKGYNVIEYGPEGSESAAAEHVTTITRAEQLRLFGSMEDNLIHHLDWQPESDEWRITNLRAAEEIGKRKQPGDVICNIAGFCQREVSDAHPDLLTAEWGIGYEGIMPNAHHVFESSAWMHCCLTKLDGSPFAANGRYFDAVIPNSFDPREFPAGKGDGGYLLYVGRMIQRKGLFTVLEIAKATGKRTILAGQGGEIKGDTFHFDGCSWKGIDNIEYVGTVDIPQRNKLMAGAEAFLCPTSYLEPFGGVAVEAQMCGTPVITVPWGAFNETVVEGETGFHCHSLHEFVRAVELAPRLDRKAIRKRAIALYSIETAADLYDAFFQRLATLPHPGWYWKPEPPPAPIADSKAEATDG